jgi:cobalt-zinc-cadmium efflux system protein
MLQPVETVGTTMMLIAWVEIFVNGISGWILMRWGEEDINIQSAYLHLLSDSLVSLGVVIGGAIIYFTGYTIVDPIISILVSLVMIASVIDIFKKSIRMNFDWVPHGMDIEEIKNEVLEVEWVLDIHHIHIWVLSTTQYALTAHILVQLWRNDKVIKDKIHHELEHDNIHHVTLETEYEKCGNEHCIC